VVGDARGGLWLAFGAVALVLVMACVNVANLFLVRAEGRQREVAVRAALGARGTSVVGGFLIEGLLLSSAGGVLGLAVAQLALTALKQVAPDNVPRLDSVAIDLPVLLFALATALLSGLSFSLLPALQAISADFVSALKDGSRGAGWGRRRLRTRQILVVGQVAMGVVLLVCAGLLVRTFTALGNVDLGFEPRGVLTLRTSLASNDYPSENELAAFVEQTLERVGALPGVESVAVASDLPFSGRGSGAGHTVEDRPLAEDELPPVFYMKNVSEGYFETLGVPLLEGRALERADWQERRGTAVVSEALAQRWWPGQSAVGKGIRQGAPPSEDGQDWYRVVGVAADVVDQDLRAEPVPRVYYPLRHREGEGGLTGGFMLLVRTSGEPSQLSGPVRDAIWALDRNVPITQVMPLLQVVDDARAGTAFSMSLLLLAAVLALLLGAIGVYGVISFVVTMRTPEIGLRLALGARQERVRNDVVRGGVVLCGVGVLVGVVAAVLVTRLLRSLLFEVSPLDPTTFLMVPLVLLVAAVAASYVPARRASQIDPATALRWE
jgi:putative ABC transport system permease protein